MTTKHTPRPWQINTTMRQYSDKLEIHNGDAHIASVTVSKKGGISPEQEANARLIAAAPDLMNILELILGASDTKNNGAYMGEAVLCRQYAETARAAIAKARGE